MNRFPAFIALGSLLLGGCVYRYDMTLTTGSVITTHGKPTLDKSGSYYLYTDAEGKPTRIFAGRVQEIAPHSDRASAKKKKK